jgi:alkylated DNA repair dioxygenase AlkB
MGVPLHMNLTLMSEVRRYRTGLEPEAGVRTISLNSFLHRIAPGFAALKVGLMFHDSLFAPPGGEPTEVLPYDLSAVIHRGAIAQSDEMMAALLETLPWQSRQIRIFGRWVDEPRLSSWHGDDGTAYRYSGITLQPQPWTPELSAIKHICENLSGSPLNSVLANLYRNGRDAMGWHSDDEPELGPEPVIASVSLGATRRFDFRHRVTKETVQVHLGPGDLLVMSQSSQRSWMHQVPRTAKVNEPRINLTFRQIMV